MLEAAILGAILGFLASVPVAGPIAALVLARGIDGHVRSGQLIAVGAALAEGVYAFLAYFGFGALLSDYPWITPATQAAGAVILIAVAVLLFRRTTTPTTATATDAPEQRSTAWGSFALGFGISIANPTLLATWTGAMTFVYGSGLVAFSPESAAAFALGTVGGVAGWFVLFLYVLQHVRRRFSPASLIVVRRVAGVLVLLLAAWFAVRFVQGVA